MANNSSWRRPAAHRDQPVGGGSVGHAQERLCQHHERQPLLGGQRIGMEEILDAAARAQPTPVAASTVPAIARADNQPVEPPAATGRKINLEFVSANPTGPIHMGGTRWAALGDSLARVLQAQGADVTREYYLA